MTPRVSVCIPVYNSEDLIGATIDSVLAQTFEDFEVVVVDNCSTDKTLETVGRYSDPRIRVEQNASNVGAVANFRVATNAGAGEYVKLLCADDLIYPDCLAKQVAALDAHPTVVLVSAKRNIIREDGSTLFPNRGLRGLVGVVEGKRAVRHAVRSGTNPFGEPAAVLMRASAVRQAGAFSGDLPYMIDLEYWTRLLKIGDLYAIQETLAAFRVVTTSWSRELAKMQGRQARQLFRQIREQEPGTISARDIGRGFAMAFGLSCVRRMAYRLPGRQPAVT